MVIGRIEKLELYRKQLPSNIYDCLRGIASFDFTQPDGKYEVNGYSMSLESPYTEPVSDRKLEGHRDYIDIAYEVETKEERMGLQLSGDTSHIVEPHEERDLYFFESEEKESTLVLKTGYFVVCFPEDLHRPLCMGPEGSMKIRKAVMKVPVVIAQ